MSTLRLTAYTSAETFRGHAEPYLMRQEAANNLMLGLIQTLIAAPHQFPAAPYLAAVDRDDAIVLACLRTPPHNLILSASDDPAALPLVTANLHAGGNELPGVTGPTSLAESFAARWVERAEGRAERVRSLRVFALRQVRPVSGVDGSLRRATPADYGLLIAWVTAFGEETGTGADRGRIAHMVTSRLDSERGGFWVWHVGAEPVTLVGATGPTPNGIRIGPVYSPPAHRRHGYASAATAAVSQLLLDAGRTFCFLYTDLANPTSNHIYQAIGYEPVRDVDDIAFHR